MKRLLQLRAAFRACTWCLLALAVYCEGNVQAQAPVISIDVNGSGVSASAQGWPLVLEITLVHPELFGSPATPVTLRADQEYWAKFLRIEINNATGDAQSWALRLLNSPSNSITLDGDQMARLTWVLSPDQTMAIPADIYTLTVTLDSSGSLNQTTWKGKSESVPVELEITAGNSELNAAERENRCRILTRYYLSLGQSEEALQQVNLLLGFDPLSIGGLTMKGQVLRELGENRLALAAVEQALVQVKARFPNAAEPPRALYKERRDLKQLLLPGRISSVALIGDGIALEWNTIAGVRYVFESSTDLENWVPRAAMVAPTNVLSWTVNRSQANEFFRVR